MVGDGCPGALRPGEHPPAAPGAVLGRRPGRGGRRRHAPGAEPAVLPLLDALHAVVDLVDDDPAGAAHLGPDRAESLLASPVGGLDATEVRALARALRAREKRRTSGAPSVAELLREALLAPGDASTGSGSGEPARPARWGSCSAARPRAARRRWHRRGGAVAAVVRHRLAAPAPAGRRPRRPGGPARAPRPRRDLRPVRGGRARRGAARAHQRHRTSSSRCAPSRSPPTPSPSGGCAGTPYACSPPTASKGLEWRFVVVAHVQDGGLAGPAGDARRCCTPTGSAPTALLPAGGRAVAAGRGATAVLRRLHPGPRAAARDRGRVTRGRRRAALPVRGRAHRRRAAGRCRRVRPAQPPPGPPPSAAVPGGAGRRAAAHPVRADRLRGDAGGRRRPARRARTGRPPRPAAGACGRPGPLVGDPRAKRVRDAGGAGRRAGDAVGQLPRRDPQPARRSGSWSARPAVRHRRASRRGSAWSCTRWPTGSPRARSPAGAAPARRCWPS